jgi:hypothetical protein
MYPYGETTREKRRETSLSRISSKRLMHRSQRKANEETTATIRLP